jgi:hypothetical protein
MNKAFLLLGIILLAPLKTAAQGTILFSNADIPNAAGNGTYNARIIIEPENTIFGNDFSVGLFTANGTLITSTTFIGSTGLFLGEEVAVPGSPAGSTPTLLVRVWPTPAGSYANAQIESRGEAAFTTQPLGGPNLTPPPPAIFTPGLTGFGSETTGIGFVLLIPEPSTYTLGLLGLGFLAFVTNHKKTIP